MKVFHARLMQSDFNVTVQLLGLPPDEKCVLVGNDVVFMVNLQVKLSLLAVEVARREREHRHVVDTIPFFLRSAVLLEAFPC